MHKFDKLSILKIHPERYNDAKVERKIKRTLQKAYMDGGKMYVICRFSRQHHESRCIKND